MKYIGIQTQQRSNNFKSIFLLFMFPVLLIGLVYLFFLVVMMFAENYSFSESSIIAGEATLQALPFVIIAATLWFFIAYFANTMMIKLATSSKTLERKENKRVYNLVENVCMANGMDMPRVNVIEDNALNAFASGISKKTYTVTLTRGIINTLDDNELEGVIAHELTHIRNRDVRLLIVSIIFVGIFTMIAQMAIRIAFYSSAGRRSSNNKNSGAGALIMILIIVALAVVGYVFSLLIRLSISRKREFMADAGAAQMTKNPVALASALRKISKNPEISGVKREDVAQLYIEHKAKGVFSSLFATHPAIENRIAILEQF
jgi:heat shock protein HtpX